MKNELGDWTRRLSLCFLFSSSAGGFSKSISFWRTYSKKKQSLRWKRSAIESLPNSNTPQFRLLQLTKQNKTNPRIQLASNHNLDQSRTQYSQASTLAISQPTRPFRSTSRTKSLTFNPNKKKGAERKEIPPLTIVKEIQRRSAEKPQKTLMESFAAEHGQRESEEKMYGLYIPKNQH